MNPDRFLVQKYHERGVKPATMLQLPEFRGINKMFIYRTINRLKATGSVKDRQRSGRPRTARTKDRIKRVREKIRRDPERKGRQLAREEHVSARSMGRILKIDLMLRPYKKRVQHGLSAQQKEARERKCKSLLKRHGRRRVKKIVFSDEKLFVVQQSHNAQNDRVYGVKFEDIPEQKRTVQRYQNSSSVMVWGAVSHNGKFPLKFIEKGVKVNAEYYITEILESHLKPEVQRLYPDGDWIFQQDSAPAHKATVTQEWLKTNCPDFITPDEWPASSPDLNPLDFCVWGVLEAKVNAKQHRTLDLLKAAIVKEWKKLSMKTVRATIESWRDRLKRVVDQNGGRFE